VASPVDVDLKKFIRDVPDFPQPGILFRDISPLLAAPSAFVACIQQLADQFRDQNVDAIVAVEARGFIFAAPLALELGASFVPVRKPGKLPCATDKVEYELEYGTDTIEIHRDAIKPGQRVLVVDDLLATGGTVAACCQLLSKRGAEIVGCAFVVQLSALNGDKRLLPHSVFSLVQYD
jgi:adenine phosphoribosyltransferase